MLGDELAPGGDDPGRIATERRELEEAHHLGVPPQPALQACDLRLRDSYENRFATGDPLTDERQGPRVELPIASVEKRLMRVTRDHAGNEGYAHVKPAPLLRE